MRFTAKEMIIAYLEVLIDLCWVVVDSGEDAEWALRRSVEIRALADELAHDGEEELGPFLGPPVRLK